MTIALDGEGDYNLTNWQEHKSACPRSVHFASLTQALRLELGI